MLSLTCIMLFTKGLFLIEYHKMNWDHTNLYHTPDLDVNWASLYQMNVKPNS